MTPVSALLPSLLSCSFQCSPHEIFRCTDLSDVFVGSAGNPLLSYRCSTCCNLKGRDQEGLLTTLLMSLPAMILFTFVGPILVFCSCFILDSWLHFLSNESLIAQVKNNLDFHFFYVVFASGVQQTALDHCSF